MINHVFVCNVIFIVLETAINIGYSCKLLTDEMEEMYVIDGDTYETVYEQMQRARDEIAKLSNSGGMLDHRDLVAFSNGGQAPPVPEVTVSEEHSGFALVMNGHSLVSMSVCLFSKTKCCKTW